VRTKSALATSPYGCIDGEDWFMEDFIGPRSHALNVGVGIDTANAEAPGLGIM
jgi:hypothetical protein